MDTHKHNIRGEVVLRPAAAADAERLGDICFRAFEKIANAHGFPPDFPSAEAAAGLMASMIAEPGIYGVVAELDGGQPVGSNFLWEYDSVSGVGPITIDPATQNLSIGRKLMEDVIRRSDEQDHPAVRLVQAAYHNRSLALYTKLGFDAVEPLSQVTGVPPAQVIEGVEVRKMTADDLTMADELCFRVHGHTRHNETAAAILRGSALVATRGGRLSGYSTSLGFFGHTIGESTEDLKALIASVQEFAGPGLLVPTRNADLLRWCLSHGLRIVQPLTLMSRGIYQEARGSFLPSILF
jgi:predicted N-acetyltransferase YhbS